MKLHMPSWHSHGKKYRLRNWLRLQVGRNTQLRIRTGWREHDHSKPVVDDYRSGSVLSLLRPTNSSRMVYNNSARSAYGK